MHKTLIQISVMLSLAFVLACSGVGAARPAQLEFTEADVSSGLDATQIKQVDDWLTAWRDIIVGSTDPNEITSARTAILKDGYGLSASVRYQGKFANSRAANMVPLLAGMLKPDDKLLRLKEVNVAAVLSSIHQVNIQPALQEMVKHSNPAVRYLGWKGYYATRNDILAQGQENTDTMMAVLKDAAAKEEIPPVVGAIFAMTNISSAIGQEVPRTRLKNAQVSALEIVRTNWSRWQGRLMTGDVDVTRAFEKGVSSLRNLTENAPSDVADKGKSLQLIVDLMRSAVEAYSVVGGKGGVASENTALLRECEGALQAISQKRNTHIREVLTNKGETLDLGAALGMAVLKWAGDLKEEFGVVEPKIKLPTPSPADSETP